MEKMAAIMGYSKVAENLRLDEAWSVYSVHPDRAMPATVHEQISYHTTYDEFVKFVETPSIEADATRHNAVFLVKEITPKM